MENGPTAGMRVTPTVRLVRQLGAGGMASVWIADHEALRTQVVVKFMARVLAADGASVARFSREAAAAAQVKSPHVVQMLDHGVTAEGTPFIVMELLEGQDLAHRLQERGRLTRVEAASIVSQAAKALGRAHERGIVHRDVKPENIFLCDVGGGEAFVKVLDFGIAKTSSSDSLRMTSTGAMVGTPYYMSPEQLVGAKTVDHRTDLWALGVVAYEALTGKVPFQADTIAALALAVHNGPLPLPTATNPELPSAVDAWFAKACARDPAERFASAKELAAALEHALSLTSHAGQGRISEAEVGVGLSSANIRAGGARVTTDGALDATQATRSLQDSIGGPLLTTSSIPKRSNSVALIGLAGMLVVVAVVGGAIMLRAQAGSTVTAPAAPVIAPPSTAPSATATATGAPTLSIALAAAAPVAPAASSAATPLPLPRPAVGRSKPHPDPAAAASTHPKATGYDDIQ